MGTQRFYGNQSRTGQGGGGVDSMAEQYIPAIRKMLLFKSATTDEIKIGVETIEKMVKTNKRITTHQVRNIFSLVTDLKNEEEADRLKELHLLRPKLAYIGARQKESDGKVIIRVLDEVIKDIDLKDGSENVLKKIEGLHYIMESIVAYHKFHSNN